MFLVKKTYVDMLTDKYNNITNGAHIRMRGIPTACIKYHAEQRK